MAYILIKLPGLVMLSYALYRRILWKVVLSRQTLSGNNAKRKIS